MASIKTLISSSIFLNLFLHIHFGNTLITRSKLCVEYRVQGGRWNQRILGSVINTTERDCLMQCTRNKRCKAYNIRQGLSLHWRHNEHVGVSNHQPRGCLLNRLFRRRWKKASNIRLEGLEGPEDPHRRNSRFRRSRDHAHASIPLAQTPWGLTGRAWVQAGAQRVVIVVSHH